jgi:phage tail-like protein
MMTESSHMVPAFHFRVLFTGLNEFAEQDSSFESVSGIHGAAPDNNDGMLSRSEKNTGIVFQPVVLRRAVSLPVQSGLRQWVLKCLNRNIYDPLKEVTIEVLNEEHSPVLLVVLKNVHAKTWSLGELHAQKSNLLMEEIGLAYQTIEIH